jgi:hypothetical protein
LAFESVYEPETVAELTCTECGRRPLPGERWSLRFADLGEVAIYCPDCDQGSSGMSTTKPRRFRRATRTCLSAAVALNIVGFAASASAQQQTSIVVRGDVQIGRFLVHRDGTLDGAIRAFGRPTSLRRGRYEDCTARWRPIGLRIGFYNLGGRNPCLRQYGYFSSATMVGRHWVTAKGLRLGDPARKLHVLYSPRRFTGSWAWLLSRYYPAYDSSYPGLAAKIHRGWVTAFRVRYPAGGD